MNKQENNLSGMCVGKKAKDHKDSLIVASNKILCGIELTKNGTKLAENQREYIPKIKDADMLLKYNYNIQQLKQIAKKYKVKITGTKSELILRIYSFLILSKFVIKIQKYFRGMLHRKFIQLHGPAFKNRNLCVNTIDFLSMEELTNITNAQFVSFKDKDGFIYGFDVISLHNLIHKAEDKQKIKNPFNNQLLTADMIKDLKTLIRYSKLLQFPIHLEMEDITENISNTKNIELRTLSLFQYIDSLGNYSNSQWFLQLNNVRLIRFIRELMDIWNYRAPLTTAVKIQICPPLGNPFIRLPNIYRFHIMEIDEIRKHILDVLDKFVTSSPNRDNQCLGAYYLLGALTLVSNDAATSLPWLYQAVCYGQEGYN